MSTWGNVGRDDPDTVRRFKIEGMPDYRAYNAMSFGRKLDYRKTLDEFLSKAESVWLSQKRRRYPSVIKEAIAMYEADQFYCCFQNGKHVKDDVFQFFYTTKQAAGARAPAILEE